LTDGNQTLAAEPGFVSNPPRIGGFELSAIRRFPDYRSELAERQPENGLALAFGAAQVLGIVMPSAQSMRALGQRRERCNVRKVCRCPGNIRIERTCPDGRVHFCACNVWIPRDIFWLLKMSIY